MVTTEIKTAIVAKGALPTEFFTGSPYASIRFKAVYGNREYLDQEKALEAARLIGEFFDRLSWDQSAEAVLALSTYNEMILTLLPFLPESAALGLFALFQINDFVSYCGGCGEDTIAVTWGTTESGYNPLRQLYSDRQVDMRFKDMAAARMHYIIIGEEKHGYQPREPHERAATCYGEILGRLALWPSLPVTRSFFEQEIKFLLDLGDGPIVPSRYVTQVIEKLEDVQTKQCFANRHVEP